MRSNDLCRLSTLSFNVVLVVAYGSTGVVIRDIKVTIRLAGYSMNGVILPCNPVRGPEGLTSRLAYTSDRSIV